MKKQFRDIKFTEELNLISDEQMETIETLENTNNEIESIKTKQTELEECCEANKEKAKENSDKLKELEPKVTQAVNDSKEAKDKATELETKLNTDVTPKLDSLWNVEDLVKKSDIAKDTNTTDEDKVLSAAQGKILKEQLNAVKEQIRTLNGGGSVTNVEVVDNLTSTDVSKALSSNQGKILKDLLDAAKQDVTALQDKVWDKQVDDELDKLKKLIDSIKALGITPNEDWTKATISDSWDIVTKEQLASKVDKVEWKWLSSNDFTNEDKSKLDNMKQIVVLNTLTSDYTTPALSAAQGKVLKGLIDKLSTSKVDKEDGKGLSTNDFTNELKNKLERDIPTAETMLNAIDARVWQLNLSQYTNNFKRRKIEPWEDLNNIKDPWFYYNPANVESDQILNHPKRQFWDRLQNMNDSAFWLMVYEASWVIQELTIFTAWYKFIRRFYDNNWNHWKVMYLSPAWHMNNSPHAIAIWDNDTWIAQHGDGKLKLFANNEEVAWFDRDWFEFSSYPTTNQAQSHLAHSLVRFDTIWNKRFRVVTQNEYNSLQKDNWTVYLITE